MRLLCNKSAGFKAELVTLLRNRGSGFKTESGSAGQDINIGVRVRLAGSSDTL